MKGDRQERATQNFNFPIKKILLFLLLCSLSTMFLGVTIAYLFQKLSEGLDSIRFPPIFLFNTLILVAASFFMHQANLAYKKDKTLRYRQMLWATLFASLLFMFAQYAGWQQMVNRGLFLSSTQGASYLYVITGLHIVHIFGGIPFLGWFIFQSWKNMREPHTVLIYFSDPERLLGLQLLTTYWHFLDALWIYLVLFFLIVNFI